jgi:predicted Rossmann fold flavoprotein
MNSSKQYDVIVIGGGASGMMAAGRAAALGKRVLLLEKNKKLGKKLEISGGGRCNITNATPEVRTLLEKYGDAAPFLFSPFAQFGVKETFNFFQGLGLPLVTQAHNRAFPKTERAIDVVNVLNQYLQKGKVIIKTDCAVEQIINENGSISGVVAGGETFIAKSYILATGGISHPETGSTGDGFDWLRELGHTVKTPTPSLVPLATREQWGHALSGISVEGVKITFFVDGQKNFSQKGKILFTHFGVSGPTILNLASKVGDLLHEGEVTALIDLYPTTDIGALDAKILSIFEANKNKLLKNVLKEFVPEGMAPGVALALIELNLETKVHSITKEQRRKIVDTLKGLSLTVTSLMDGNRAVVADGGVMLDEVDTKTMCSKKLNNLYITGDLLNINRPSGGYSLQLCWTTGWVAGSNA